MSTKHQRIVVKVGTNVLQRPNGKLDYNIISELCDQISTLLKQGHELLFVTSGAVGAGRELNQFEAEKDPLVREQMMAAVGQVRLMQIYFDNFLEHQVMIAQVLLTRNDFSSRKSYLNIRNTLEGLLKQQVLPIINQNDVVSTEELAGQFNDNDQLAVYVAALIHAHRVIFLTTANGLYVPAALSSSGQDELVEEVEEVNDKLLAYCGQSKTPSGKGGMFSKLKAADMAMRFGIDVNVLSGKSPDALLRVLNGEAVGTFFKKSEAVVNSYRKWMLAGAVSEGKIYIDQGAENALLNNKSLLAAGIVAFEGKFEARDYVSIINPEGVEVGIGRTEINHIELKEYLTYRHSEDKTLIRKAVVHRDHLTLLEHISG